MPADDEVRPEFGEVLRGFEQRLTQLQGAARRGGGHVRVEADVASPRRQLCQCCQKAAVAVPDLHDGGLGR